MKKVVSAEMWFGGEFVGAAKGREKGKREEFTNKCTRGTLLQSH